MSQYRIKSTLIVMICTHKSRAHLIFVPQRVARLESETPPFQHPNPPTMRPENTEVKLAFKTSIKAGKMVSFYAFCTYKTNAITSVTLYAVLPVERS